MCLILFAHQVHGDYPLIVAANRDEIYQRPTRSLHQWPDQPGLFAGRDLEKQGTWLGVTQSGRFAAVTNVRNGGAATDPDWLSRGQLPQQFLAGNQNPTQFGQQLEPDWHRYPGFNLLLADQQQLAYISNRREDPEITEHTESVAAIDRHPTHPGFRSESLQPGVYGLSNAALNTSWPKLDRAKQRLTELCQQPNLDTSELFDLLQDRHVAADHLLPDTGISLEWERILAPGFIQAETYGTRASTLVLWHRSGKMTIIEQNFDKRGPTDRKEFSFSPQP